MLPQLNDVLNPVTSLVDGFGGYENLGFPGFLLAEGNDTFTPGVGSIITTPISQAYAPAVSSQPNCITNSLGLPASISVSRLGVLLNTGQTFTVRGDD